MVNNFTRVRYLQGQTLEFNHRALLSIEQQRLLNLKPWFKVERHLSIQKRIVFGHWASLGLYQDNQVSCIDSGCVYGHPLTSLCLNDGEIIQCS
jgi:bis(5'-nucleosyl)-tetraphosphatase (symmetrical)